MSCGVGRRCGSDPVLLWLWRRPAGAAQIQPLAWELPYAAGAELKRKKKKIHTHTHGSWGTWAYETPKGNHLNLVLKTKNEVIVGS